TVL
ncbi:pyruvate kinase, barrel domain protein, partial [Vibrio harveyi]